jgi:hypothetical protein
MAQIVAMYAEMVKIKLDFSKLTIFFEKKLVKIASNTRHFFEKKLVKIATNTRHFFPEKW